MKQAIQKYMIKDFTNHHKKSKAKDEVFEFSTQIN